MHACGCFDLISFFFFCVFCAKDNISLGMLAREDEVLGDGVLAVYNGMKFKMNDLVDVIVGTMHGVRGSKAEPIKARFKGVVETVRGVEFLCRPLVGSGRGRCPEFPRHSVYKVSAFGVCVLGTRNTRYFSKLQPSEQERYYLPVPCFYIYLTLFA
jgi:hypothetical protein